MLADRFGVFHDTVFRHVRRRQDQQRLHVQNDARHAGHGQRHGAADGERRTLAIVRQARRAKAADGRAAEAQQQRGNEWPVGGFAGRGHIATSR